MPNWITFDKAGFSSTMNAVSNTLKKLDSAIGIDTDKVKAAAGKKTLSPVSALSARDYNGLYTSSGGSGGGGSGGSGGATSAEDIYDLINRTAEANNEWSAAQAQKQMDFQMYMSNTAHQREVADLKAAGLNPVLSAGGQGSSTPAGAMGDTDTSNTRLLAEVAMASLSAMSNTAQGYAMASAAANGKKSLIGNISQMYNSNKLFRKVVDTGINYGMKYLISSL